jgi:peroxiredoxin
MAEPSRIPLPGDPAPWFHAVTSDNANYQFASVGGLFVVMCFFGSTKNPASAAALRAVHDRQTLFDAKKAIFFGVSTDPSDRVEKRATDAPPGITTFWDFDFAVSRLYGAVPSDAEDAATSFRGFWLILDPLMRVLRRFPLEDSDAALRFASKLPSLADFAGPDLHAPVLILPRVFEPGFCRHLIELYERHGGEESGFMRERDGKTILVHDPARKRRSDYTIEEQDVVNACRARVGRRVVPEIFKAYQFNATRMERYIVACYDAADNAHFRAHRDNTTKGTAHRQFAVTINLNADEYDGGDLSFPEFGPRRYRAPTGGAVVFSCSLIHEVAPITRGRRFAFLPFLYDEEHAKLREANSAFLAGEGLPQYRAKMEEAAAKTAAE